MSITVCTVSGKGGTGKSTVSSGLAIAASLKGNKVLMIDLDAGLRCLDTIFGIDDKIVFDLADALACDDIQKAVYQAANYQNIFIIPAPSKAGEIDFERLSVSLNAVKSNYDIIILDFPAGSDFKAYSYFKEALFLIVTGSDDVSTKAAAAISLGLDNNTDKRLIINRFDKDMITSGFYKNIDGVIDASLTRLIGIVPTDGELLLLSLNHSLKPKGRAQKAFDRILRRISGENIALPKLKKI